MRSRLWHHTGLGPVEIGRRHNFVAATRSFASLERRKTVLPCSCQPLGVEPDGLHLELEWRSEYQWQPLRVGVCVAVRDLGHDTSDEGGEVQTMAEPELGIGVPPLPSILPPSVPAKAARLTVAQESRGAGTLEVVILAEITLIAAFTVAHATSALALAAA